MSAISGSNSFFHIRQKARRFVEITRNNIRHKPLGGGSGPAGKLSQLGLLLGGKLNFQCPCSFIFHNTGIWEDLSPMTCRSKPETCP